MAAGAAVLAGVVARVLCARGDLWLDEIGAFIHTAGMRSVLDAVLTVHSDNNHPINTAWAWVLGPRRAALLYRLPALIAGAASIVLAGFVNRLQLYGTAAPRALRPVAIGSILFASSYLLVHYDSEARGYAIAVACGLVALLAALRGSWTIGPWAHLYAVGAMLAVLAHPLAVHLLAGLVAWHVAEELARRDPKGAAARLAAWQGPPIVFALGLWLVHLRRLEIGGGPRLETRRVLSDAIAYAFGLPDAVAPWLSLPLAAACLGLGIWVLRSVDSPGAPRRAAAAGSGTAGRRRLWVFYATSVVISPVAVRLISRNELVYERYFLISLAMMLLLGAAVLERLARRRPWGALAAAMLLLLSASGSAGRIAELAKVGRGEHLEPLRRMVGATLGPVVVVGGNNDLWIGAPVQYYGPEAAGPGRRVVYVPSDEWPEGGPQWFIWAWQTGGDAAPERGFTWAGGRGPGFERVASYAYARMSGFNWAVYRNVGLSEPR